MLLSISIAVVFGMSSGNGRPAIAASEVASEPLPASWESERAVLGALMLDNGIAREVLPTLTPPDFATPLHRNLFVAMARCLERAGSIEIAVLWGHLKLHEPALLGELGVDEDQAGAELMRLAEEATHGGLALTVAPQLRDFRIKRQIESGRRRVAGARNAEELREAASELSAALEGGDARRSDEPRTLAQLRDEIEALRSAPRYPTGIPPLDPKLGGGLMARWFGIIGSGTGQGKTTTLRRLAAGYAAAGHHVLAVSLELAACEFAHGIPESVAPHEAPNVERNLVLFDQSRELSRVLSVAQRFVQESDGERPPVVCVDYVQKIQAPAQASREREVAVVLDALQQLGRRHGHITLCAAQLNRNPDAREDGKPRLSDFRESASIEQAADVALLLEKIGADVLRIHLAKARWGVAGDEINLSVDWARCRVGELSEAQAWAPFAERVAEYLARHGGRDTTRKVCMAVMGLKGRTSHPSKADLQAAATATGAFVIDGTEARLP